MADTFVKSADYAAWPAEVKSHIRLARISVYSQPAFLQQAVAKLNRLATLEFLEQSVPELWGKLLTSRQLSEDLEGLLKVSDEETG